MLGVWTVLLRSCWSWKREQLEIYVEREFQVTMFVGHMPHCGTGGRSDHYFYQHAHPSFMWVQTRYIFLCCTHAHVVQVKSSFIATKLIVTSTYTMGVQLWLAKGNPEGIIKIPLSRATLIIT